MLLEFYKERFLRENRRGGNYFLNGDYLKFEAEWKILKSKAKYNTLI